VAAGAEHAHDPSPALDTFRRHVHFDVDLGAFVIATTPLAATAREFTRYNVKVLQGVF
jgi:hypothetical protein